MASEHSRLPRCADVDAAFLWDWEARVTAWNQREYGRSHAQAVSATILNWYAGVAATVGALFFLLDRRVPRLDQEVVSFGLHSDHLYPDRVALHDRRFWCLSLDPDAAHPDATVVDNELTLANLLRAEVRRHADGFLASYRPSARLPRRHLAGAFFDGLDAGFWLSEPSVPDQEMVATAALVLPGGTEQFAEKSTLQMVVDGTVGPAVTRRRVSCCYYFKVSAGAQTCSTCPRVCDSRLPMQNHC